MARYRKSSKKLSDLNPDSPEYWEEILKREGLSMSRGTYPQKMFYVGVSSDITKLADAEGICDEDSPYQPRENYGRHRKPSPQLD